MKIAIVGGVAGGASAAARAVNVPIDDLSGGYTTYCQSQAASTAT